MGLFQVKLRKLLTGTFTIIIAAILLLIAGCNGSSSKPPKVAVELQPIKRYEQALFSIHPDSLGIGLKRIQDEFLVFLDADLDNSLNLLKVNDFITTPEFVMLNNDVQKVYPDLDFLQGELSDAFGYLKAAYPDFEVPVVFSYVSGLDVEQPVKISGNNLIIGLDLYLGSDNAVYAMAGFPKYKTHWMRKESLLADCMREYALNFMPDQSPRNILDHIVSNGKQLYFVSQMIPGLHDSLLLRYTASQLDWAQRFQGNTWTYFIENQLLYSTETSMVRQIINDAPFSSAFGNDSPPRILWFVGYEMIKAYMKQNRSVSIPELMMMTDSQEILQASRYRPKNKN